MDTHLVIIKNTSGGYAGYTIANRNIRRELSPNMELRISFDEMQEGLFDPGLRRMFTEGILSFKNKQDAIDLGLIEEEIPVVIDDSEIVAILQSNHSGNIYNLMKTAAGAEKDRIIDAIIKHKILNEPTIKWADELLGFNPLTAITNIRNAELAPDPTDA